MKFNYSSIGNCRTIVTLIDLLDTEKKHPLNVYNKITATLPGNERHLF